MAALSDHLARTSLKLKGYKSRRISTSVGEVHVLESRVGGTLPPLVLLHGFSSAGVHYLPLLPGLHGRVKKIILPDAPGHGFSPKPRPGLRASTLRGGLIEALDAVLDEPALIFGNSMGGIGAVHYALARPENVLGIILCSPSGAAMDHDELARFARSFQMNSHADALEFVDRLMAKPTALRQVLAWGVRRKFRHPHMRALLSSMTPEDLLTPEHLRALTVPVLLMWGRAERILPKEHLEFFRRHLPDHARVEEPEDFGHSPYLDDPGRLARDILSFAEDLGRKRLAG
jgi:pimeloyl-ACP methyl ester carboxylesterase